MLAPGLPWIDALFESVSALTTTGLEQEDLVGSSRAHSRRTLGVYPVLTGLAFLLLWPLLGAWEGLLYTLSGVSTGGFAPRDASVQEFPFATQVLILLLACAAALPPVLYYRGLKTGWGSLLRNLQVRGLLGLTPAFGAPLGVALGRAGELPWEKAWRQGRCWRLRPRAAPWACPAPSPAPNCRTGPSRRCAPTCCSGDWRF